MTGPSLTDGYLSDAQARKYGYKNASQMQARAHYLASQQRPMTGIRQAQEPMITAPSGGLWDAMFAIHPAILFKKIAEKFGKATGQ